MFLPFNSSSGTASGAAAAAPVTLSGIRTGDVVLSIIKWKPGAGGAAAAVDPANFVVTDNAIEDPAVDTDTFKLFVIWTRP